MTSRILVALAALAVLAFGGAAQAQQWQQHQWRGEAQGPHQQQQWRGHVQQPQQHWEHRQWQAPAYTQRWDAPRYEQRVYNNYAPRYYAAPSYRAWNHGPRYYAGGYYTGHRYWINDWRARRLYAPPYGYGWVETDTGDALLIALATGLIASAILAY